MLMIAICISAYYVFMVPHSIFSDSGVRYALAARGLAVRLSMLISWFGILECVELVQNLGQYLYID
jgi:hypothetical protein